MSATLTFDEVSKINLERCMRWHPGGLAEWSPSDWACAMAGEAGEACNAVKKLNRIDGGIPVQSNTPPSRQAAIAAIAQEIGDTVLYLDLLAQRLGINLADAVAGTFNRVSEREGFPERIGG